MKILEGNHYICVEVPERREYLFKKGNVYYCPRDYLLTTEIGLNFTVNGMVDFSSCFRIKKNKLYPDE